MKPEISPKTVTCPAVLVVLLCTVPIFAQVRKFKWNDDFCEYRGTYNAKRYTLAQLRNTEKLLGRGIYSIQTSATVFDPADLPKLDLSELEREYATKVAELNGLDIVKVPYWQELRKQTLAEMKQVYELSRVTIPGHSNPEMLNRITWADSCKTKYAVPLIAGGDFLLSTWRAVNEKSRANNGDPDRVRRIFDERYASPDRMKFALVEVMTFGWWNCANQFINYVETEGTQEREFKKLFTRVRTTRCDEP
jgi:hypothetical protein